MLALSVRQPWAWAILRGGKDVENRDWCNRMRGRVLLHAAGRRIREDHEAAQDSIFRINRDLCVPGFDALTYGAIVGAVTIADCVSRSASPWFVGRYGFVLRDAVELATPVPCRGALGFWTVPQSEARAALEQIGGGP